MKNLKPKTILLIAFLIRLLLLPLTYHGDVQVTYWWGKFATDFTLTGYYDWLNFGGYGQPDQPMINIFYCRIIRQIYLFIFNIIWYINTHFPLFPSNLMTWYEVHGNQILLKFPMIIADILLIKLVYTYFLSQKKLKLAKLSLIILAFYPPLIYNSAIWGSGDSIVSYFALLSLLLLFKKNYLVFPIFFLVSIYYKPSLVILLPLFLIVFFKTAPSVKNILTTLFMSLLFIYLISLPFAPKETFPIVWNFSTMTQKILPGCMHQLTSNAMNLWALFFGLKPPLLDEIVVFGLLPARQLSILVTLTLYAFIYKKLIKNYSQDNIILAWVNIALVTFTFLTRMHERYTFPALIPLIILSLKYKIFKKPLIFLTITHMLNVYNWWWWQHIGILVKFLEFKPVIRLISLSNICLTLYLFYIQQRYSNTIKNK